ncbi:MAG: hydrogenase expression/formation protein [Burkholderiales bacterium]|nr:hydrogenase expression/formation protein [Burkholderiales bacterium]
MRDFPIPVVASGAAPAPAEDLELDYMAMPGAEPLRTPIPPEGAAPSDLAAAAAVVEQLLESMGRHRPGGPNAPRFSLRAMAPGALAALNDSLGQGEVSAIVAGGSGGSLWRVQETAFAGVWRARREDANGSPLEDVLEAGDVPAVVKEAANRLPAARLDAQRLPPGVMNAPAIVEELRHHVQRQKPGQAAHVVNLSLLPLVQADHAGLEALLGEGPLAILSRGFGNCRISSTQARGIWRVRYFNSMNTLILDTIEIVDFPESARAGAEDYDDSIERLRELLRWLREG